MAWRPFAEISDQDIENLMERAIPDNTKKATKYGMKILNGRVRYVYICIWHTILFNRKIFFANESWNLSLEWNIDKKLNSLLSFCTNIEWLGTRHEYTVPVQEVEKQQLSECLKTFYLCIRKKDGSFFKVSSLKAIRAAVERFLKSAPNSKPRSIISDHQFKEANEMPWMLLRSPLDVKEKSAVSFTKIP